MPKNYARMRHLPFDPKMVREIRGNSRMNYEQGQSWMSDWGTPENYGFLARLPEDERLVYAAIQDGYTELNSIETVTGLSYSEINSGVKGLQKKGLIGAETTPL